MIFWFLHSCLCVLLDVEDVRRRVDDPEAELLPLRHALRVVCRQVNGPAWTLQTGAIMAARSRLLTHPALGGWLHQKRSSRGTASPCAANGQRLGMGGVVIPDLGENRRKVLQQPVLNCRAVTYPRHSDFGQPRDWRCLPRQDVDGAPGPLDELGDRALVV